MNKQRREPVKGRHSYTLTKADVMKKRIVWIARDLENGPMCYVLFNQYPIQHKTERWVKRKDSIRIDLANELAEQMLGRELRIGELVKLELGEVERL